MNYSYYDSKSDYSGNRKIIFRSILSDMWPGIATVEQLVLAVAAHHYHLYNSIYALYFYTAYTIKTGRRKCALIFELAVIEVRN
jgi:hypothetical protein